MTSRYGKRLRSIIIGVIIISFFPTLFFGVEQQKSMKPWEYMLGGRAYSLFPDIFEKFLYSMTILLAALLFGLFLALTITFISTLLPRSLQKIIYGFYTMLEALPDLFIIIVLQVSVVAIYKKTGLLIGNVSNVYESKIYFFPILTLSILPAIQLFKITYLLLNEEMNKPYVNVARSLGHSNVYITINHVFRNVLASLFHYSRTIFVFMLSNLFILEYVFNLHGIMTIMLNTKGVAFIITVLFVAIPFSFLFEWIERYTQRLNVHREEEAA
ncbi:ABC transporter permease subunit [Fictibacillus norfolkensis]|uniref:ABC transporter permease subunit n=1 Tax=Fictibacillus norfolkensis TaxID=2762233 RepID=A0ABR8SGZ5_9BACL|nr:ABC transporter permease subunit [Fictibacillus norfolkensis]MBD7962747.1 ABC transporter permease subunit [Fictibacillus norfolkensis]